MQLLRTSIGIALTSTLFCVGCLETGEPDEDTGVLEQFTFISDLGVALAVPVTTNNTSGRSNDFLPNCAFSDAPDASYIWTAPSSGTFTFDTSGSTFDTILEIRRFNTLESLGCNDDSNGTLQSTVSASLLADETVLIIVDGFSTASGPFQLNITGAGVAMPSVVVSEAERSAYRRKHNLP